METVGDDIPKKLLKKYDLEDRRKIVQAEKKGLDEDIKEIEEEIRRDTMEANQGKLL